MSDDYPNLVQSVEDALPMHDDDCCPHRPTSSAWCKGCAARGFTPLTPEVPR